MGKELTIMGSMPYRVELAVREVIFASGDEAKIVM